MSVQGVSTQLYADDAVIFTPAKTTTEAGQILTAAANSGFKIFKCPFDGKKSCVKLKSFTVLLSTIALPVFYLQAKSAVLSGSSHSPPLVLCCSGTSAMTQW